jgi:hypothetical protein
MARERNIHSHSQRLGGVGLGTDHHASYTHIIGVLGVVVV